MDSARRANVTLGLTRKSLEATVIYACPHCGAPGVRDGRLVGAVCPGCGGRRRRDKELGEISASMPRWLWRCVLAFKWCLIKLKGART